VQHVRYNNGMRMNRRSFLSLGGLFGVGAGLAATVSHASRPTDPRAMVSCEGAHEPVAAYIDGDPAICIGTTDDPARTLVPCKRCGALFALPLKAAQAPSMLFSGRIR